MSRKICILFVLNLSHSHIFSKRNLNLSNVSSLNWILNKSLYGQEINYVQAKRLRTCCFILHNACISMFAFQMHSSIFIFYKLFLINKWLKLFKIITGGNCLNHKFLILLSIEIIWNLLFGNLKLSQLGFRFQFWINIDHQYCNVNFKTYIWLQGLLISST